MSKAIVLVSGGMDSCVTTSIASKQFSKLALLHVNYGQLTQERELQAFKDIQKFYSIKDSLIIDMCQFNIIGGSSLTDSNIPVTKADLNNKKIPSSYVPFRNANILSFAVSWAEVINAKSIFIGAVEEDSSGYPDCRRSFFDAFEKAIDKAAMRAGMAGTDDYLIEWRKAAPYIVEGDADSIAEQEATRLETEYDKAHILRLIANHGYAQSLCSGTGDG